MDLTKLLESFDEPMAFDYHISRLFVTASRSFTSFFKAGNVAIDLKEFFFTLPIEVKYKPVPNKEWETVMKELPNPFVWMFGGFIVLSKDDISYKPTVTLLIKIPESLDEKKMAQLYEQASFRVSGLTPEQAFLYVYLHELFHILFKHFSTIITAKITGVVYDVNPKLVESWKNEDTDISVFLNYVYDFFVNGTLIDQSTLKSSILNSIVDKNGARVLLYSEQFKGKTIEEIAEVLAKKIKITKRKKSFSSLFKSRDQAQQSQQQNNSQSSKSKGQQQTNNKQQSAADEGKSQQQQNQQPQQGCGNMPGIEVVETEFELDGQKFKHSYVKVPKLTGNSSDDSTASSLEEAFNSLRNSLAAKIKGSGSAKIFEELGVPLEVNVDWLKSLMAPLMVQSKHYGNRATVSWRKLRLKYRHIAKLPQIQYLENRFDVIISIDQSGSMSDIDLRKINYVMDSLLVHCRSILLLIHDDVVVKKEVITRANPRSLNSILNTLKYRHSKGGTSHKDVFDTIEDYVKAKNHYIYLCFSDMYSDIEHIISKYKWPNYVLSYFVITAKGVTLDEMPISKARYKKLDMTTGLFLN